MTKQAEEDYEKNQANPGTSGEALKDKDDEKAGVNLKWVIIIAVAALAIVYFLFFRNTGNF